MNIDELTLGQIKQLKSIVGCGTPTQTGPWQIGKKYIIRTVTMMQVGELVSVGERELVLRNASWIADSGRFHDALKTGELSEVEPFTNDCIVGRGAIVDAQEWAHALPAEQK